VTKSYSGGYTMEGVLLDEIANTISDDTEEKMILDSKFLGELLDQIANIV